MKFQVTLFITWLLFLHTVHSASIGLEDSAEADVGRTYNVVPECRDGDRLTAEENDGCNSCWCGTDRYVCTLMACKVMTIEDWKLKNQVDDPSESLEAMRKKAEYKKKMDKLVAQIMEQVQGWRKNNYVSPRPSGKQSGGNFCDPRYKEC